MLERITSILVLSTALSLTTDAALAAPPSSLNSVATETTLDAEQEKRIGEYAGYWLSRLESGTPEETKRARNKLVEPVRSMLGNSSSIFRSTYAGDLVPGLKKIIQGDDLYRAVNALQIAGFLGSDQVMRLLVDTADSELESSPEKRLWATIAIREAIQSGNLSPRRISSAIRSLARFAATEPDWRVLTREMETISSAAQSGLSKDQGGDEIRALGRELQLSTLTSTVDRLTSDSGQIELIYALRPGILEFRQQYLNPQMVDHRREIALGTAPQLGRVYVILLNHYDLIRENEKLSDASGMMLRLSEETLKLIDSDVGGGSTPNANSLSAWNSGQRSTIEQNQAAWATVLSAPPYTGN